jgi:hypothetical protein
MMYCMGAISIISGKLLPAFCILFFLLAFFPILTGRYWGKAKSILPNELESKRIAIGTRHNRLVGMMTLVALAALFLTIVYLAHTREFWVGIVGLGTIEVYALRRVLQYDDQMCKQLGFICPHCQKPLYEPRSFVKLNGRCPKCQKSILSDTQRSAALR